MYLRQSKRSCSSENYDNAVWASTLWTPWPISRAKRSNVPHSTKLLTILQLDVGCSPRLFTRRLSAWYKNLDFNNFVELMHYNSFFLL
jgi:hypothetical protein